MSIIKTENICKSFGSVEVLKNVSLTVEPGEVVVIIGPSGAGKSTYLRSLNHLEKPTSGKIWIDDKLIEDRVNGHNQVKLPHKERAAILLEMGMVFQRFNLFPHKTALQNVMLAPMNVKGVPEKEAKEKAVKLLNQVGLGDKLDSYPAKLSGGQQQRVAIARALATEPKVLLCDEATSALDPKTTRQILELIRDINQKLHITVVIITHQMSVVKEVCSHVAILDDGCVAEEGMVGTVFAAPRSDAGRRLVFPGGADAQVYNPEDERLVRLVFKDSQTTSIPLIARLASEEGILCNVISASTQKLSETVYGSMMLGIPSSQFDKALAFINTVANVRVEEVDRHV